MKKDIADKIIQRSKGTCEMCTDTAEHLHHSISGRGKRTEHETVESVYHLCSSCHDEVHQNRLIDLMLKFTTQNRYKAKGKSEEDIRRLMGDRLYTSIDIEKVLKLRNEIIDDTKIERIMRGIE